MTSSFQSVGESFQSSILLNIPRILQQIDRVTVALRILEFFQGSLGDASLAEAKSCIYYEGLLEADHFKEGALDRPRLWLLEKDSAEWRSFGKFSTYGR